MVGSAGIQPHWLGILVGVGIGVWFVRTAWVNWFRDHFK